MAEDLSATAAEGAGERRAARALPPAAAHGRREGVFVGRFRLVYALLAVLLGAAVGGFVVLSGDTDGVSGPRWSEWQPNGSVTERPTEIARFVSRQYRLESGSQLVAVTVARPPTVQEVPVEYVALSAGEQEDIRVLPADDTVAYVLCGLGQNCGIREGQPSVERAALLRREALELALYTFKYVDGVDSVVAFLPPRLGTRPRFALFFQKEDLKAALDRPLHETLAPRRAISPTSLPFTETDDIGRFANRHLFQYSFGQTPNGSVFLALRPPPL
jgi:hypothetical protein